MQPLLPLPTAIPTIYTTSTQPAPITTADSTTVDSPADVEVVAGVVGHCSLSPRTLSIYDSLCHRLKSLSSHFCHSSIPAITDHLSYLKAQLSKLNLARRNVSRTLQTLSIQCERLRSEDETDRRSLREERLVLGRDRRIEREMKLVVAGEKKEMREGPLWGENGEESRVKRRLDEARKELVNGRDAQRRCESEAIEVREVLRGLEMVVAQGKKEIGKQRFELEELHDQMGLIADVPKVMKDQWEALNVRKERIQNEELAARDRLRKLRAVEEKLRAKLVVATAEEQRLAKRQDDFLALSATQDREIQSKKAMIASIQMQKDVLYEEIAKSEKKLIEERAGFSQFLEAKLDLIGQKGEYQTEIEGMKKRISFLENDLVMFESRRAKAEMTRGELAVAFMNAKKILDSIDDEVVVLLESYLREDRALAKVVDALKNREGEVQSLDSRCGSLLDEEKVLLAELKRLTRSRDLIDRDTLEQQTLFTTRMALAQSIDNENKELAREVREARQSLKSVRRDLSVVRQSRGRYGRMMQENLHFLRTCDQKRDMLVTEVKIMRRKEASKEGDLLKVRSEADAAQKRVEKQQAKTAALDTQLETFVDELEDVRSETTKIQVEIDRYEAVVEDVTQKTASHEQAKMAAAAALVEREEELQGLGAKSDVLRNQLTEGELALQSCKEEFRRSGIAVKQLRLSHSFATRKGLEKRQLEDQRDSLVTELRAQEEKLKQLLRELERDTSSRVSEVCRTKILPKDQLRREISGLLDRLRAANESLMERNLILTELTKVSDQLRRATSDWRHSAYSNPSSSRSLSVVHAELRKAVQTGRSLCAENSLWDGRVRTMEEANLELREYESELLESMKSGAIPLLIQEKFMHDRVRQNALRRDETESFTGSSGGTVDGMHMPMGFGNTPEVRVREVMTTAKLRPNCYIPLAEGSIGVPKPYPGFAPPVLPTECGAKMRSFAGNPSRRTLQI